MFGKILDNQNPFWQYMGRLFDAVMVNLLWLICSLPVFTVGASTAAAYTVLIAKKRDKAGQTTALFFQAFRDNFSYGTLGFLLFGAALAFLCFDLWYFASTGTWAAAVLVALVLLIANLISPWFFIVTAIFRNTFKNTLANATILALRHPFLSLGMLLINLTMIALGAISLLYYPVLFMVVLLLGFGVCAFFHIELFYPLFSPALEDEAPKNDAKKDRS